LGWALTLISVFIKKQTPKVFAFFMAVDFVIRLIFLTTLINQCELFIICLLLPTFYLLKVDLSAF